MELNKLIKDVDTNIDFYQDKNKTNSVIEDIKLKLISENLKLTFYRVEFSYRTIRGNNKENIKYIISDDDEDATFKFIEYINRFNRKYSFRPYLNVKILKCANEGNIRILIK